MKYLPLIIVCFLASCSKERGLTEDIPLKVSPPGEAVGKYDDIKVGMSYAKVKEILGAPDSERKRTPIHLSVSYMDVQKASDVSGLSSGEFTDVGIVLEIENGIVKTAEPIVRQMIIGK